MRGGVQHATMATGKNGSRVGGVEGDETTLPPPHSHHVPTTLAAPGIGPGTLDGLCQGWLTRPCVCPPSQVTGGGGALQPVHGGRLGTRLHAQERATEPCAMGRGPQALPLVQQATTSGDTRQRWATEWVHKGHWKREAPGHHPGDQQKGNR